MGYTRQYYYKLHKEARFKTEKENAIIDLVKEYTVSATTRTGTRKLHLLIKDEMAGIELSCGRDKLFRYLKELGLFLSSPNDGKYTTTDLPKH